MTMESGDAPGTRADIGKRPQGERTGYQIGHGFAGICVIKWYKPSPTLLDARPSLSLQESL